MSFIVNPGASSHEWMWIGHLIETIANAGAVKHKQILLYNCCSVTFSLLLACNYYISSSFPWSWNTHDHFFMTGLRAMAMCLIYGHPVTSQFQSGPMNYYMSKTKPKGIYIVFCIIVIYISGQPIRKPFVLILDINLPILSYQSLSDPTKKKCKCNYFIT